MSNNYSEQDEALVNSSKNNNLDIPDKQSDLKLKINKSIRSKKPPSDNGDLEEKFSNVSFSISAVSDIDDLYDNLSNKSDEKNDYVFESNTKNAEEQLEKYIEEELTKAFVKAKPGFDQDVKNLSQEFYKKISNSLSDNKNRTTLDKTNMVTKCTNIDETGGDQTMKLKNDLTGVPLVIQPDITTTANNINIDMSGKNTSKKSSKLVSKESNENNENNESENKDSKKQGNTMSLEYSKEKESDKKELVSSSSKQEGGNDEPDKEAKIKDSINESLSKKKSSKKVVDKDLVEESEASEPSKKISKKNIRKEGYEEIGKDQSNDIGIVQDNEDKADDLEEEEDD